MALAALALSACGGGSGPGSTAAQPAASASAPSAPASSPSGGASAPAPAASSPTSPPVAGKWQPAVGDTWQWQLKGTVDTTYNVRVYDIDLFDTPQATITALKAAGRVVVCYFSAGSSENWRPDFNQFQAADMGNALQGWPGERWLDTRSANVRRIMLARLDLALSKGCDGVEPDNVDGYTNSPGFALDATTQLDYNRFIAREARARGLRVGLKNDTAQVADLQADFDFAVNEQCHEYSTGGTSECAVYAAFTQAGKPVFNAEYKADYVNNTNGARDALCASSRAAGLRTLVLPVALDNSFRFSCDR
ncbi:MAG: endo alpha-1,4 polygalactosaminidase [Betaproteobacteria bacterium]|nr:endo alpha-1,4 polygalactosaminidase [Betaproteobacteria bacterium]